MPDIELETQFIFSEIRVKVHSYRYRFDQIFLNYNKYKKYNI